MDLPSAVALRELGFSATFPDLTRILEDKAEAGLLESTFTYQSCVPEAQTKSTFLISISADGSFLASCHSGEHCIIVTEVSSGKTLHTLRGHARTVWALACHPTKSYLLASGCLAGEVRVWDLNTGCADSIVVDEGRSAVASLAFHPTGRLLAVANSNKLSLWDWHDPKPWGEAKTKPTERLRYVKFNQSGTLLYTGITNVDSEATRTSRQVAPPDIIPYRCHELLNSRRQLIEMRSELSDRHRQLLTRYNDLLRRYRDLQAQYPNASDYTPERPEDHPDHYPLSPHPAYNREEILGLRPSVPPPPPPPGVSVPAPVPPPHPSFLAEGAEYAQPPSSQGISTEQEPESSNQDGLASARVPAPPRISMRLQVRRASRVSPGREETLTPIQLEQLRDAVGYAHQLTQESMQQFLDHHQMSMERLQRSYMEMSQSAQRLVRSFQRTYDDMCRLQERIDRQLGLPTVEAGQDCAGALLRALTRMQQILLSNANTESDSEYRPILREANTLIEVFDSLLDGESQRFPSETMEELSASRERLIQLRTRLENTPSDEVFTNRIDRLLAAEIHGFRGIIRRWKAIVMSRIRERYGPSVATPDSGQDNGAPAPPSSPNLSHNEDIQEESPHLDVESLSSERDAESSGAGTSEETPRRDGPPESDTQTRAEQDKSERKMEGGESGRKRQAETPRQETSSSGFVRLSLSPTNDGEGVRAEESAVMPPISTVLGRVETRTVGNVTISPMKPGGSAPSPRRSGQPSASLAVVRINLSPSRTTVSKEAALTSIRYQYPLATKEENPAPPEKRRKLDFQTEREQEEPGTSTQGREESVEAERSSAETESWEKGKEPGGAEQDNDGPPRLEAEGAPGVVESHPRDVEVSPDGEAESNSDGDPTNTLEAENARNDVTSRNNGLLDPAESQMVSGDQIPDRDQGMDRQEGNGRSREDGASSNDMGVQTERRRLMDIDWEGRRRLIEDRLSRRPHLSTVAGRRRERLRRATASIGALMERATEMDEASRQEMEGVMRSSAVETLANRAEVEIGRRMGLSHRRIAQNIARQRPVSEAYPGEERGGAAGTSRQGPSTSQEETDREDVYSLHRSINRAIAGAFIGSGDIAIANNILDLTCRIQEWKFRVDKVLPNFQEGRRNVLVERCKLHNDGSVSLSGDGEVVACFVEALHSENPVWANTELNVVSLRSYDKGTVLFRLAFGPNAISVSISPTDSHILVGLATRRYLRLRQSPDTFAQVYKMTGLDNPNEEERKLQLILNLNRVIPSHPGENFEAYVEMRRCTLNCSSWLPHPGQGFAYGTNKGHLYLLTPIAGSDKEITNSGESRNEVNTQNVII